LSLVKDGGKAATLTYDDFGLSMVVNDSKGILMEEAFLSF
jgi:hypothetical protein